MCSPISGVPRTRNAATTRSTASAGRSRSPMSASRIPCARPSSKPCSRRASDATMISMGRTRRAAAISAHGAQRTAMVDGGRLPAAGAAPPNLEVVSNALASRILLYGRRAVGVEYRIGDVTRRARAEGEVIIAAGAFNSPQLLQLSGSAPPRCCSSLGIDVIADMPGVGADLQDHLQVRMQYRCTEPITMNDVINNWRHRVGAGLRYVLFRKGLLDHRRGLCRRFLSHQCRCRDPRRPGAFHHFQRRQGWRAAASVPGLHRVGLSIAATQPRLRTHQIGRSPGAAGDPAALSLEPARSRSLVAGMKLLRGIMGQPAMRRYIAEERAPGPHCTSDAELLAFARETATTVFHPTSTCRMGPMRPPLSTSGCACAASDICAWWTARSCPRSSRATPTQRS